MAIHKTHPDQGGLMRLTRELPMGVGLEAEQHMLQLVRNARGACGRSCPRCRSPAVIRWGSFLAPDRTRQRYRCHDCKRTFSDLTATSLAYTKRLACWHAYLLLMNQTATLRHSATALKIHTSTAFRWRHRVLRALHDAGAPQLAGWIELHPFNLAWSQKGTPVAHREPRVRGRRFRGRDRLRLLYVAAREGPWNAFVLDREVSREGVKELLQSIVPRLWLMHDPATTAVLTTNIAPRSTIVHRERTTSFFARNARRSGFRYISTCPSQAAPAGVMYYDSALAHRRAHDRWLHRFRGVASAYYHHYIAWYRFSAAATSLMWLERCVRSWCPAPP